jgi:NADH-quinone oxidoreductase subunit D
MAAAEVGIAVEDIGEIGGTACRPEVALLSTDANQPFDPEGVPANLDPVVEGYDNAGWLSPSPPDGIVVPRNVRRVADDPHSISTDHYLLNMGPQHPSTHGVLRMVLEMDGERIMSSEAHVGQLHRGIEKLAEHRRYNQLAALLDRADYVSGIHSELAAALAVEQLAEIEVPPRASWLRVLMGEVNRISSHYMWMGPTGLDTGAMGIFLFMMYDREVFLDVLEEMCGSRMMFNYVRPGGVLGDLTPRAEQLLRSYLTRAQQRLDEHWDSLFASELFQQRTCGVAVVNRQDALDFAGTGFIARAAGVDWDLRRDRPYAAYDCMEFEVMTREEGDIFARMVVRLDEIRQSYRIIEQCLDGLPEGPISAKVPKVLRVPQGQAYVPVEGPRGEVGVQLTADGSDKPARLHLRPPTLHSLNIADTILPGQLLADAIVSLGSFDFCFGEVDR